jgi:hypothetical protein
MLLSERNALTNEINAAKPELATPDAATPDVA